MRAITEFSFGFAFTRELLNQLPNVDVAPYFPSLREEGAGRGYDVKIGFAGLPIFIQFKISEALTRPQSKYWPDYLRPYYRFDVTSLRRSRQHNDLKDLSQNEPEVYYVAPRFWKPRDFDIYYSASEILANSICIPVTGLDYLTDTDHHQITYVTPDSYDWHSTDNDRVHGDFAGTHLVSSIQERFSQDRLRRIDEEFVAQLYSILVSIARRSDFGVPSDFPPVPESLAGVRFLLAAYFGLEFLLLTESANP